jgi:hypothetical protein
MKTLYPQLRLTDPRFNYVSSAKTDIRETFRRFSAPKNQDKNKPLVPQGGQSLDKPLVPILIPDGFVLSAEWFEMD